jgi:hypothetical protein
MGDAHPFSYRSVITEDPTNFTSDSIAVFRPGSQAEHTPGAIAPDLTVVNATFLTRHMMKRMDAQAGLPADR